MLTCLLYVVRGSDFHQQNLIASGEDPVPVDMETLFAPEVRTFAMNTFGTTESLSGVRKFLGTVLQTLLLPAWIPGPDGKSALDLSGLGSPDHYQECGQGQGWTGINTDVMQFGYCPVGFPPSLNLPTVGMDPVNPVDFVAEITDGFTDAYRALMRHREALLAPEGPIEAFRDCPARMVLRATRLYEEVTLRSLAPQFLRNGFVRSLELEVFSRAFLGPNERYDGSGIFLAELESLEQLDIPRFNAHPELDCLVLMNGKRLAGVLKEPAFPAVVAGIRALAEDDLEYQLELIRSSFAARDLRPESHTRGRAEIAPAEAASATPLQDAELIERARGIADRIARRAVWDGDAARWLGLDFNYNIGRGCMQALEPNLYSGRAGIALFFAAMYAAGGRDPEHRRLARGAAHSVWQDFWGPAMDADSTATTVKECGIGMGAGLAGIAYALLTAARLLNEPGLVEDAIRAGRLISEELIAEDKELDVMSGVAGSILGLLPLWKASGEQLFLDRIAMCGDLLARRQINDNGKTGGWITFAPRPLTGFSHGTAGMALALSRAARATGDSRYLAAAGRAIAYERSAFLPEENNWSSRAEAGAERTPKGAWCYGAPGIGLARIGCLECGGDDAMRGEIETAVRWVETNPIGYADHVCCGEFGRVEVLIEAGRRFRRPEWEDLARRRVAATIARAGADRGFHSMIGPAESLFTPGFFNGLAGIGYQILRLAANPGELPSVLLWQ